MSEPKCENVEKKKLGLNDGRKLMLHGAIFLATCVGTNVALQVARKSSPVTPHFCNLQCASCKKSRIILNFSQRCETSCCVSIVTCNAMCENEPTRARLLRLAGDFKMGEGGRVDHFQRVHCQLPKSVAERMTPPLRLAVFCIRHRCNTSCKKNCTV